MSHFVFEAKNYTDGLKKALTALEDISKTHPALIVVPWSKCSSNKWCNKCFDHEVMKYSQFKLHANALYQQIRRQYVRNLFMLNEWYQNIQVIKMVVKYNLSFLFSQLFILKELIHLRPKNGLRIQRTET